MRHPVLESFATRITRVKEQNEGQDADHDASLGCSWDVIRDAVGVGGAKDGTAVRATARAVGIAACVLPARQCRSRCVKEGRFVYEDSYRFV